jgi:hypothetical protein
VRQLRRIAAPTRITTSLRHHHNARLSVHSIAPHIH